MCIQAYIINKKKLNTTTNINTAKVAKNKANIFNIVTIIYFLQKMAASRPTIAQNNMVPNTIK
jgi:hypothetical protein